MQSVQWAEAEVRESRTRGFNDNDLCECLSAAGKSLPHDGVGGHQATVTADKVSSDC